MPAGWEWTRIGSICIINPRNNISDNLEVSFVPMSLISEGYTNMYTYEIRTWSKVKSGFTHFAENDIGIAKITPCFENRKSVIFKDLVNGYGAGTTELHILRTLDDTISNEYLLWIAKMDSFIQGGVHTFSGAVGQQRVGKDYISQYLIPVPPRNEQTRIIQKINSIFEFIIRIENAKEDLEEIIRQAKSKILDLAIRGQLVPQDPNDEPASVLLERIRAEKEELIKQGKIKRDKKESIIFKGEDNSYYEKIGKEIHCINAEIPFDIPKSWGFVRLKNVGEIVGGGTPKTNVSEYWDGNIPWLTPADFSSHEGMYISTGARSITEKGLKSSSARMIPTNSVLFSSRAPIGYIAIAANPVSTNQGFKSIVPYDFAMAPYLYYCLKARTNNIIQRATGTTFKEISGSAMAETIIPLPPINEQKRIFCKATHLFSVLTTIEKSLI